MFTNDAVATFRKEPVYEYTIKNEAITLSALSYGATITGIYTKDKHGVMENIVASYDHIMDYEKQPGPYLNAIVGPVAGRIAYGQYEIDHQPQQLSFNSNQHHLHGGFTGVSRSCFHLIEEDSHATRLHFQLVKSHEEDGYPKGLYTYDIIYALENNTMTIDYLCTPVQKTLLNMTTHLYFNLSGDLKEAITTHDLQIPATKKLAIHEDGHPYKVEQIVDGSAFDFKQLCNLQQNIAKGDVEFTYTKGIDTAFLLEKKPIILYHKESGRRLQITTDQQSVVVYTANYFDEALDLNKGKHGYPNCCIALETQDAPNGINIPELSTHQLYDAHHPYHQTTTYTFDTL